LVGLNQTIDRVLIYELIGLEMGLSLGVEVESGLGLGFDLKVNLHLIKLIKNLI